jgi:hypothetical protein
LLLLSTPCSLLCLVLALLTPLRVHSRGLGLMSVAAA